MRSPYCRLLLLLLFPSLAPAQEVLETNRPGLKWYQINTAHFRVLYPAGFESQAQRMANTFEHIREPEAATMGVKPKKISILMQAESSQSNGFVTLAPRRSELFTTPSQNYNFIGTNDWLNALATHEYRHMVQFQRSVTGFNKFIYYLFGQQGLAGMAFVGAPQWFWEGDAVATETAFTHSGRGRIPNFDLLFRTNLQEGRVFNYHKQYLRSYKHNISNHYVLGYHMISYLRKKSGDPEIWERIAKRAWGASIVPFTFSNAIKKEAGLHVVDLYNEMATELQAQWNQESEGLKLTKYEQVNPRNTSAYTDYLYPQVLADGSVVAMKSGIGDIQKLVVLSQGKEYKSFVPGPVVETGQLSGGSSKVVWNEERYDPRWLVRSYSVIMGFDLGTGNEQVVSSHSRYASAAISPDGYQVATVETSVDYQVRLVILDYYSGKAVKVFENPGNNLISMPHWSDDGKSIIALRLSKEGKAVSQFDVANGTVVDLLPPSQENIGAPLLFGKYLLYNSPFSGIDNIYAFDSGSGKKYQVTSSRYGAYNPAVSPDGQTLYYNEQGKDGMDVVKIPFDPFFWTPLESVPVSGEGNFKHLVEQEHTPDLLQNIPQQTYPASRYRKIKGILNPHSWGPYTTSSLSYLDIGISSDDIMSTTSIGVGYRYDVSERTGYWRAGVSYQALYPILDVQYTNGTRSSTRNYLNSGQLEEITFDWHEQNLEGGLRIPLLTTRSKYRSQITLGNKAGITKVTGFQNSVDQNGRYFFDQLDNGNLVYNHATLYASRLLKRSRRDFFSKWGQVVSIDAMSTPYGGDYRGKLFAFYGGAYFPGLVKHHSLNGYWAYQKTFMEPASDVYYFRNQVPVPRGLSLPRYENLYTMSGNYAFPIWYPDIAVGPLINFQRVRGNVFMDYAYGKTTSTTSSKVIDKAYASAGAELKFDVNIMRYLPQVNFGVRFSYDLYANVAQYEFIVGNIGF